MACTAHGVSAQETASKAPIFINPYSPSVPTTTSKMPTIVQSNRGNGRWSQSNRTYTNPNRVSGPQYDEVFNPFGQGYGRMRSEKSFYDDVTGKQYKQYEYFALLAGRGETAKLQAAVRDVQQNGVFDPAKYRAALSGVSDTSGSTVTPRRQVTAQPTTSRQVTRNLSESDMPQKLHSGYDEETEQPAEQPQQRRSGPIFLR